MTYFAAPGIINYKPKSLTIEDVERYVCGYYNISPKEIHKRCKKLEIVTCRQVIMYLCVEMRINSTIYIGKYFNRHHSTVVVNRQVIRDRIRYEEKMKMDIQNIKHNLHYRLFN